MRDDWVAARRLSSAFHSGAADNFLSAVFEIDTTERWQAVALALVGEVSTLADLAHGGDAQDWLDHRLGSLLDRGDRSE
ncbi:MAG: hypothetical protein WBB00_13275 [Mycobacterium sp.]